MAVSANRVSDHIAKEGFRIRAVLRTPHVRLHSHRGPISAALHIARVLVPEEVTEPINVLTCERSGSRFCTSARTKCVAAPDRQLYLGKTLDIKVAVPLDGARRGKP